MAISSSPDWSPTTITSHRKTHSRTPFSTSKILSFLSVSRSTRPFFHINCSFCPSPLLEDDSTSVKTIEPQQKFPDLEQCRGPKLENPNVFLRGLLNDRRTEALAFEYYQKAKIQPEFRPESSTLQLLIRYLLRSKKWSSISLISEDFKAFSVFPDRITSSRLVGSCIRARKFKTAKALLESFESNGELVVSAFDSAMRSYNKLHMYSSTILLYNQMKSAGILPDPSCYCHIMEAYRKISDTDKVVSLFCEFESRKLIEPTSFSTQIYGILCDSLGKSGRAFEALEYFRDMTKKGISEDSSIYSSLICSFASIREVKMAKEIFEEAREKQMVKDPALFLKLILMYVEEGLMDKTLDIVKAMKQAKIRVSDCIFCAVVNGYSKKRGPKVAIRVYEDLVSQGCEPGQVTYASVISIYCGIGLHTKAEMTYFEMEQKGFDKCIVAYATMVSMYGKVGRLRDAMKLVAKMKERGCEPNVWIYNSLIDMHGRAQNLRQVEKLWKEMKRRKVAPDKVSYTSLITAYSKAGEFEACIKLYQEFRFNGGKLDRALAGIMVGVFSKSSRINELMKLLQDMKLEGTGLDVKLYRSALNALRDAGLQVQVKWFEESFASTRIKFLTVNRSLKTMMTKKYKLGSFEQSL
ncbi:PREDICTED: pentatricopeptide repeat-containing protein At5g13770, chloroplastic [Nelumbo nucifera]|uniref:Pentatricopeptide repeat-containing protein At5g13770, chloroplastic n=1 Tax=Nelumbo nucifera TaxID=4432 RepID=A0A1U8AW14_NELNU|nr:PREDICTED: pentatricopeptide repeat-containing protein At5g13770, chloroplastic [Nelumbo nucifera]